MRVNNFIKGSLLVMAPLVFFWGCSKGNAPVGPSSGSVASINVPLTDSHGKDLTSTQVSVLYYIAGTGAPVTGNAGTASASTGNSFSFDVRLPSTATYSFVAVQINDASTNQIIAAGATTMSTGMVPVTLGPVNKPIYQETLGLGVAFGFEADATTVVGPNTATTTPGFDVVCNQSSDGTGFELDNPALTNNTIAYMGNGHFVNYLQLPTTFSASSSASKSQFATGPNSMAPGDVYCVKLLAGGYAWLQVSSVSAAGPLFVYRVNTTLPYCGYEQTTADLASSPIPTPTATAVAAAVTVWGTYSVNAPYDVALLPASGPATTVFTADSVAGYVYAFDVPTTVSHQFSSPATTLTPLGLVVDSTGTYLYVADPGLSMVNQFQINGGYSFTWKGCIGNPTVVSPPDSVPQASLGALAKPQYVALDSTGNLFITDTGTNNVADVMEYFNPIAVLTTPTSVNYWKGSLSSAVTNSIGQVTNAGTTVIVANSFNNRIDFYSSAGVSIAPSLSSDNNTGSVVAFSNPQGVAYSTATGLLYVSDTGNNRIVEMTLSGAFVKVLGPTLGTYTLSGPTGIKVDTAILPTIYIADTLNNRVVILK